MKVPNQAPLFRAVLLLLACVPALFAQITAPLTLREAPVLQEIVDRTATLMLEKFSAQNLKPEELAITVVDLRDTNQPTWASYRGDVQIYPASVVKAFYLVAAHQWMQDGKLADTEELRRAMKDMIVDSLNEATGLVVDSLTDTTSGPELSLAELEKWYEKRNAVNRYFAGLGYEKINVNRKPWCEGPYGREKQSVNLHKPNHRNWLTTQATARLMSEIAMGRAVSPERSRQMMALLERRPFDKNAEGQSREFTGTALPPGTKLWSKAGWTSEVRHDAAYVELPDGGKFVMVIFTTGHANDKGIITAVARQLITGLGAKP